MTRSIFLLLVLLRLAVYGEEEMKLPPLVKDLATVAIPVDLKEAELLSRVACSLCHSYPEPDLLPKAVWNENVLPKMKMYLGIDRLDVAKTPEGALFKASGLFPDAPRIPKENWPKIAGFYLTQAPAQLPVVSKPEITVGLKHFSTDKPKFRHTPPLTTAVKIQADEQVVFFGDATEQGVDVLTSDGDRLTKMEAGNIPTSIKKIGEYMYIGAIGHFFPREDKRGQLLSLQITEKGLNRKLIASGLPRVAHVEPADLNGDGKIDLAVSMFGYLTGRYSWFEGSAPDEFKEHVITNRAGAVQSAAHDFDKDGDLDLAVLFGQELESLLIYQNDGKGKFTSPREVFHLPASYGHAAFDLADFNKDGRMDFVVANGDNGDYESPPKPYHGLRIYLAEENGKFTEKYFYPMHGAFGVKARDFDQDGDIDLAAISFFPDYTSNPRDSFVYLDNNSKMEFTASTFRECISGRWVTMDAGDLDGDGDDDIALGSLIRMPTVVPKFLTDIWEKSGPSVLVLRNQTVTPDSEAVILLK